MTSPREWLLGLKRKGIRLGLERIHQVVQDIDAPRCVIRVGGTNGKGSVCALLGSILQQAGHDVGVYTSPELERVNERIVINGTAISDKELEWYAARLMECTVDLTFFEAMTAIALLHFSGRVDYAILEVGMGGRYDATAVIPADVTVITNVSLDHMEHLGDTVEAIAGEIAGAITGSDVVTACTEPARRIIARQAAEDNARLHVVTGDMWQQTRARRFVVQAARRYDLATRLHGTYQGQNMALAVQTAEVLCIDPQSIVNGIATAWLPGRMERVGTVLLDGAHNPAAMRGLRMSLEGMDVRPGCIVFGAMCDKDIPGIISELPEGDIIATAAPTDRAASGAALAEMLRDAGRECLVADTVAAALEKARDQAGQGVILVTGSFRLVGEIRKLLR